MSKEPGRVAYHASIGGSVDDDFWNDHVPEDVKAAWAAVEAAIRADEREMCAKVAEDWMARAGFGPSDGENIADAIRVSPETKKPSHHQG